MAQFSEGAVQAAEVQSAIASLADIESSGETDFHIIRMAEFELLNMNARKAIELLARTQRGGHEAHLTRVIAKAKLEDWGGARAASADFRQALNSASRSFIDPWTAHLAELVLGWKFQDRERVRGVEIEDLLRAAVV
jgi:hypothetical protein